MADKPTASTAAPRGGVGFNPAGVAAVSFGVFLWAASTVIVKGSHVSGVTFAVCRLWVGAPALWLVARLSGRRVSWDIWRASFVPGVLFAANSRCSSRRCSARRSPTSRSSRASNRH